MTAGLSRLIKQLQQPPLLVTPGVDAFLLEHGEIVLGYAEANKLVELTMATPRDRTWSWAASGSGRCNRERTFAAMGVPQRKTLNMVQQNLFNDGTWRHLRWQMMLLLSGVATDVEVGYQNAELVLRGSIDAVSGDDFGIELKGTSQFSAISREGPSPDHVAQIHAYMILSGLQKFALVYEDKRSQQWLEFLIERSPTIEARVRADLDILNIGWRDQVLPEILPDCIRKVGDDYNWCAFRDTCLTTKSWSEAEATTPYYREGGNRRHRSPNGSK